jgi:hypothetical protein
MNESTNSVSGISMVEPKGPSLFMSGVVGAEEKMFQSQNSFSYPTFVLQKNFPDPIF